MQIDLRPEHEAFIQNQLAIGRYNTVDELLGAALTLLSQQDAQINALRQQIAIGTEQIRQGRVVDGETVFHNLQAKISQISKSIK
jgi:antitoxin ParD1/3/4